jgi:quinol-cytochrome oxidoreductase complex cytochrome b subunit
LHLWLIRHLGVSARGSATAAFSAHLRPLGGFSLILVGLLAVAALSWPASLLPPGVTGSELTKPFWPFLWIYAAENLFGVSGMLVAPGVLFGFLALVPVTDRQDGSLAKITRLAGIILFVLMIAAIVYAAVAPGQSHLDMGM